MGIELCQIVLLHILGRKNIIVTHQGPLEEVEVPDKVERVVDLPCLLVNQEILLRVNCKSPQNGKAAQYFFPPASLTIQ